ncbi:single-stranded DNA-binding protein [Mucilaginibacter sp. UYCu711]
MPGINKAILIGHIGKVSELIHLNDDVAEIGFPLAVTEFIKLEERRRSNRPNGLI